MERRPGRSPPFLLGGPGGQMADCFFGDPEDLHYASAGTVSAQVSTFARIASSLYEVRDTLLRVNVRS